jgi:hypothetical protein
MQAAVQGLHDTRPQWVKMKQQFAPVYGLGTQLQLQGCVSVAWRPVSVSAMHVLSLWVIG